ncbi:hypothetical protein C8Q73DRAFT_694808 [Cubamyces lactineus]|nr:hypothetical protein C8Q73DRAFT_694808 [Cubamyces lactineus]
MRPMPADRLTGMARLRLRQTLTLILAIVQHLQDGYTQNSLKLPSQCTDPDYSWLTNSAGQTACDVANAVASSCIASIAGPLLTSSSCPCNTVLYSLLCACILCAGPPTRQFPCCTLHSMRAETTADLTYL